MQITVYDEQNQNTVFDLRTLDAYSAVYCTAHYAFHYKPGSFAEKHIRSIAEEQERCFTKITALLGIPFCDTIRYVLTNSPEENGRILEELFGEYEPGNGFAVGPNNIFATYSETIRCVGAHEDTHLISYAYCDPSCELLCEGLAMYMDGEWWGKPNAEWVKAFLLDGSCRSVFELADDETFRNTACEISYPIAGAFTAYLIERLGTAAFLEHIYKPKASLAEKTKQVFHKTPEEVEKGFIAWITAAQDDITMHI